MNVIRKQHGNFLKFLLLSSRKQRMALLKEIEPSQIRAIVQIVYNVMMGNRSMPASLIKKLVKRKTVIRRFISKGLTLAKRKQLLTKYFDVIKPFIEVVHKEL